MAVAEPPLGSIKGDYKAYGAAAELWRSKRPEILISGPAGTGKSRAALEKLYACAVKYPGMRGLLARKTRESLSEAALFTFEEKVLPAGSSLAFGSQRRMRQRYQLVNGSEIIVAGLDKPEKIMSTEYDLIYVQEATECEERDIEMLTTRLRNAVMPYQQLLMDCNPDAPQHWLYQRCASGATQLLESRHEENPTVTPAYLAKLDALTGVRYKRLRLGLWVAAEGQVYEEWDPVVHCVDAAPVNTNGRVVCGVDWGFVHPGVIEVFSLDGDDRMVRTFEVYRSGRTIDWWIEQAKAIHARAPVEAFVCDPSEPAYIQQFRAAGLPAIEAFNGVAPGVQAVAQRLIVQPDGRPRLLFMRGASAGRDPELVDKKLPTSLEEEMPGYVWDTTANRKKGEQPLKVNDDSVDALRYAVCYVDGIGHSRWLPWSGLGETRDF